MIKKILKFAKRTILSLMVLSLLLVSIVLFIWQDKGFGGSMSDESLAKAKKSTQYTNGNFENNPKAIPSNLTTTFKEFLGDQIRKPSSHFPMEKPQINVSVANGIKATWFGHATVYVEMDGKRIMTDPMLSTHAFPVKWLAPERYNPVPLEVDKLPAIDIVTISHDHFDHLDMETVKALAKKGTHFFVGLGIKAHLKEWGIPDTQINEMDWWDTVVFDDFKIHFTPARHYSGRKMMNNATLWASWFIESKNHKIYHSGDSGYAGHFKTIGEKFGPIDIGFIKIGDYGEDVGWRDIHMHTEKSVMAAKDLNVKMMFPIHWGTFALSYHDWFEPINLAVKYAGKYRMNLVTPKLGQSIDPEQPILKENWWKPLEK